MDLLSTDAYEIIWPWKSEGERLHYEEHLAIIGNTLQEIKES